MLARRAPLREAFRELSLSLIRGKAHELIEQVGRQHIAWLSPFEVLQLLEMLDVNTVIGWTEKFEARLEKLAAEHHRTFRVSVGTAFDFYKKGMAPEDAADAILAAAKTNFVEDFEIALWALIGKDADLERILHLDPITDGEVEVLFKRGCSPAEAAMEIADLARHKTPREIGDLL